MQEKEILQLIENKIITYLKYKNYSSNKIREKLKLLKYKYPDKNKYQYFTDIYIEKTIKKFEKLNLLNDKKYIIDIYKILDRKIWSNQKIKFYLQNNLLYSQKLIEDFKGLKNRDELKHKKQIIKEVKEKINIWRKKIKNQYLLENKIKQFLYKKLYTIDSINEIMEELKKENS